MNTELLSLGLINPLLFAWKWVGRYPSSRNNQILKSHYFLAAGELCTDRGNHPVTSSTAAHPHIFHQGLQKVLWKLFLAKTKKSCISKAYTAISGNLAASSAVEKQVAFLKMLGFSYVFFLIKKLFQKPIGCQIPAEGASDFLMKAPVQRFCSHLFPTILEKIEQVHRKFTATVFLSCVCANVCSGKGGSDKWLKACTTQTCASHVFRALLPFL